MHAKKSHVIEASTRHCRWVLVALLPCDFAFTVALMTQPHIDTTTTFEESEDLNVAVTKLATASITALLSIITLFLVVPRYKLLITRRMIGVFSLRIISVMLLVPELAYPTHLRTALNVIILILIFVELVVVCVVFVKISKINRAFYGQKRRENSVNLLLKDERKDPGQFVETLDEWLLLKDSRKMLRRKFHVAQTGWAVASVAVLAIAIVIFITDFAKIASTQQSLYPASIIDDMNSFSRIAYYNTTRDATYKQQKVLVVVLDGLRYDYLHSNTEMELFFTSPLVAPHAKIIKMNAQLPSMSVPNWVTILTGAPPEATGVLGNLLVPETKFDSIFRQAATYNLNRGLTGSPWFAGIIDSTLPFLEGDATIPTSLGASGKQTSDFADDERASVTKTALTKRDYALFLAHFSDIDIQGHCCGVSTKYNKENSYNEATTNKSVILEDIVSWLDNDTTLFIVADHGHVDRGGHGGIGRALTEVPLVIYKKNSFLANRTYAGPRFSREPKNFDLEEEVMYSNLDVAPTICAILGVPVPRQCDGKFIDDAMLLVNNSTIHSAYYDLYKQKESWVEAFIQSSRASTTYEVPNLGPGLTAAEYVSAVKDLTDVRQSLRDKTMMAEQARNIVTTTVIVVGIAVCLMLVLQAVTFCDPRSIISRRHTIVRQKNRIAAALSLLVVFGYYGLSILAFYLSFLGIGYEIWDSTVIHYPQVLTRYVCVTLIPGIIIIYITMRSIHIHYSILPDFSIMSHSLSACANPVLLGRNPILKDAGLIYLFRYYLSWWTVVSWLILLILQSSYTFIIPPVFAIKYITSSLWVFRFRILTVQLMSLPLVLSSFILLYFGLPSRNANKPSFDPVYILKITKDLTHAGHPKSLENLNDDIPPEDPILLHHKNQVFYSAILQEAAQQNFSRVLTIYDVTSVVGDFKKSSTELQKVEEFANLSNLSQED